MLSAGFETAIPGSKWLHLRPHGSWDQLAVAVGMIKVAIYVSIKLGKETMNVIRFICWIVLIRTAVKIFCVLYFWSNLFYYSNYTCVVLSRSVFTLCCDKYRHNFLEDSNNKFTLLYTYPITVVYVPSEIKFR
jgi:hypothetical protein